MAPLAMVAAFLGLGCGRLDRGAADAVVGIRREDDHCVDGVLDGVVLEYAFRGRWLHKRLLRRRIGVVSQLKVGECMKLCVARSLFVCSRIEVYVGNLLVEFFNLPKIDCQKKLMKEYKFQRH